MYDDAIFGFAIKPFIIIININPILVYYRYKKKMKVSGTSLYPLTSSLDWITHNSLLKLSTIFNSRFFLYKKYHIKFSFIDMDYKLPI